MKQLIRLEYNDCFSENPQEISNYFQGISRYDLLRLCPLFLTRKARPYMTTYQVISPKKDYSEVFCKDDA